MIFFTGDIHGAVDGIAEFITKVHPTMKDVIVLLGDVGAPFAVCLLRFAPSFSAPDDGAFFICAPPYRAHK